MDVISSGDGCDDGPMSTDMLEGICNGSQSHLNIKRREVIYNIRGCLKQRQ